MMVDNRNAIPHATEPEMSDSAEPNVAADRRELIELALEYSAITGNPVKETASPRTKNGYARDVVANLLGMTPVRVREWFHRNPVPPFALVALRLAVRAERLEAHIATITHHLRQKEQHQREIDALLESKCAEQRQPQ